MPRPIGPARALHVDFHQRPAHPLDRLRYRAGVVVQQIESSSLLATTPASPESTDLCSICFSLNCNQATRHANCHCFCPRTRAEFGHNRADVKLRGML